MKKVQLSYWFVVFLPVWVHAQCPDISFDVPSNLCLEESLFLENVQNTASEFTWDFCAGDILNDVSAESLTTISALSNLRGLVTDYEAGVGIVGFAIGENNKVVRIRFGEEIDADNIQIQELSVLSSVLNVPRGLAKVVAGGQKYLLIGNSSNGSIVRVAFGTSWVNANPSGTTLSGIVGLSGLRGLSAYAQGSRLVVFAGGVGVGNSQIGVLDFPTGITSAPVQSTINISGAGGLGQVRVVNDCGEWLGLVSSFTQNRIYKLFFGADLRTIESTQMVDGVEAPLSSELRIENGEYYGLVSTTSGDFWRIGFGSDYNLEDDTELENLTSLGILSNTTDFSIYERNSETIAFCVGFSDKKLSAIRFDDTCGANVPTSSESVPADVRYSQPGIKLISLVGRSASGSTERVSHSVSVVNSMAPQIDFSIGTGNCANNEIMFTSSIQSGNVTDYEWFFDGVSDATTANASFAFSTTGDHVVRLVVNDGTCSNVVEKIVTVYEEVTEPTFSLVGSLCTNNQVAVLNSTDDAVYPEELVSYEWFLDAVKISEEKAPTITFSSSGEHEVRVTRSIPGCSAEATELVEIDEGPAVSLDFSNSCWDEETAQADVQFTASVTGNYVYTWDFGDNSTSSAEAPSHTYSTPGDYNVALTILDNNTGCSISSAPQVVGISDQPMADFGYSFVFDLVPVEFAGVDQSPPNEMINVWTWKIDGQLSSEVQNPTFEFDSPGTYTVDLSVTTNRECEFTVSKEVEVSEYPCPIVDFSSPSTVCVGEMLEIENNTEKAESYEWDFCAGDLANSVSAKNIGTLIALTGLRDIVIVETELDESIIGFVVGENNRLLRVNFGTTIGSQALQAEELTSVSGLLNIPRGMTMVEEGTQKYLLIGNSGDGSITKVDFGTDYASAPLSASKLEGLTGLSNLRGLNAYWQGDDLIVIAGGTSTNNSLIEVLEFKGGISGIVTQSTITIPGAAGLNQVRVINQCGQWYGITSSFSQNRVYQLDFGDDLRTLNNHKFFTGIQTPLVTAIQEDGGSIFGLIGTTSGSFWRVNFGNDFMADNPTKEDLTNLSVLSASTGLAIYQRNSETNAIMVGYNNRTVTAINFANNCSALNPLSNEQTPINIEYSESGTYQITLKARGGSGVFSSLSKQIIVSGSQAPQIDFSFNGICVNSEVAFVPTGAIESITQYEWMVDGVVVSNDSQMTTSFGQSGSYQVKVDVTDGSCTNSVQKEVLIYEQIPAPSIVFEEVACSNRILKYSNDTDDTAYPAGTVQYQWLMGGAEFSTARSPEITFEAAGDHSIQVIRSIPGCSATFQSTLEVLEGPVSAFKAENLCWDSTLGKASVRFNPFEVDNLNEYQWDLGDGNSFEGATFTHEYLEPGSFSVVLSVKNSESGCVSVSNSLDITFSHDQPVTIQYPEIRENEPVQFLISESFTNNDQIVDWEWNFGDNSTSKLPTPLHTYQSNGKLTLRLNYITLNGCVGELVSEIDVAPVICPIVDFSSPSTVCVGEMLEIENNTEKAESYEWDFCAGDLANSVSAKNIGTLIALTGLRDIVIVETELDESIIGFVVGESNRLVRVNFGTTIGSQALQAEELTSVSGLLNIPRGMTMVEEGTQKYLLIGNSGDGSITKVDFGTDYASAPLSASKLEGLTGLSNLRGLNAYWQGDDLIVIAGGTSTNNSLIEVLEFKGGISGIVTQSTITIPGAAGLNQVRVINQCGQWYGITSSFSQNRVYQLDFGDDLRTLNNHKFFTGIQTPLVTAIQEDGGSIFGLIGTTPGSFWRVNFGSDFMADNPTKEDLTKLSVLSASTGLAMYQRNSETNAIMVGYNNRTVTAVNFANNCSALNPLSNEQTPINIEYSESGTYQITLKATGVSGNIERTYASVTVSDITATPIDFNIDENICTGNPNQFTFIGDPAEITRYSWDFNHDGLEDSAEPNPTYQFPAAGEYRVSLGVQNEAGCSNLVIKTVNIYNRPAPDFEFTFDGGLCSNNSISFKDLTAGLPPDSLVTWSWDFNGETILDTKDTVHTFTSGGEKIVKLTVGIPGCSGSVSKKIDLKEGPTVSFELANNCLAAVTPFVNTSSGQGITGYFWDFGNGYTSTSESPETFYEQIGTYRVGLTLTNEVGCETTSSRDISIHAVPVPNFTYGLACSGSEVQFTDASSVENGSIVAWNWDFAGLGSSNLPTPGFTFSSVGTFKVRLNVVTNDGCAAFIEKEIQVQSTPQVSMEIIDACQGGSVLFNDLSSASEDNPITERLWSINGSLYTTPEVAVTFDSPGIYNATLTVTTQNLCTASQAQTFEVQALPFIDFIYSDACDNELISFTDLSTSGEADPIVSKRWDFDGQSTANGSRAFYQFTEPGNHLVTLSLATQKGCELYLTKNIEVSASPAASFTNSPSVGQLPVRVNFVNTSANANYFLWFLGDGTEPVSTEQHFSQSFEREGEYQVSMVAFNEAGCSDTVSTNLIVDLPKVDLQIRSLNYSDLNGKVRFVLNLKNQGTVDQTDFGIEILVDNSLSVVETFSGTLAAGQSVSYAPEFELVVSGSPVERVCVRLIPSLEEGETEFSPFDNINCLSFTEGFLVNSPYPNPVEDRLTFELILPGEGDVEIALLSMTGQPMFSEKYHGLKAGLTSISLQMGHLNKGLYMLRIQGAGNEAVRRILKR